MELYSTLKKGKSGPFATRVPAEIGIDIAYLSFLCSIKLKLNVCIHLRDLVAVDMFARDKDVFCDPKVDGVLRLGEFIGDKKYEKDYMPMCSCHSNEES